MVSYSLAVKGEKMNANIEKALSEIAQGKPVLIYDFDDREKETDMTIASEFVTSGILRTMRNDAGGLICTTTPYKKAMSIGLPFLADVFWTARDKYPLLGKMLPDDIPYDNTKSSFGVTINHRKTYTGITDDDRALTITEYVRILFADKPDNEISEDMGRDFRAPGHVHLLNTSSKILKTRHGHTELCTAMMYMAGVRPSATICEMMGNDGKAADKSTVKEYAVKNAMTFVTGEEVIAAWEEFLLRTGLDV